jgi:hypothetical protein
LDGEIGISRTEFATRMKVGDGKTPWRDLPYVT